MVKKLKFRKVIEWDYVKNNDTGEPWTYKDVLIMGIIFLIPIIGQISALVFIFGSLKHRSVHYEKE